MTRTCPDCNGRGKIGAQLCRTCNPSGALGDIAASWGRRLRNKVTGRSRTSTDDRTRTTRMGRETVRLSPAKKRALPANQKPSARKTTGTRAAVHGQQASTATKTGHCGKCRGVYGLTKGGHVRRHKDLATGHPCPGGGKPAKAGRPKQPQRQPPNSTRAPAASRPAARRMPQEATAEQVDPARRRKVVDAVRVRFAAADNVEPREIFFAANGEIWVDRRGRDPRNVPMPVGRWK